MISTQELLCAMRDALVLAWSERLGAEIARERANNAAQSLSDQSEPLLPTLRYALDCARDPAYGGLALTDVEIDRLVTGGALEIAMACLDQIRSEQWRTQLYDLMARVA